MIYFINPVQNPNVGDIAIFYSTSNFFKRNKLEYKIINRDNYYPFETTMDDFVVLCGGGWLGIYDDELMEFFYNIIQSYNDKAKVILMPSSFAPIKDSFKKICDCKCTIFARDMQSYKNYKQYFKNANVYYCNDMAYMLPTTNCRKSFDIDKNSIGIYDRNDAESISKDIKLLHENGILEGRFNSTVQCNYDISQAYNYITRHLFTMSKYKLIITDTLHMSIFAYLLNLPCLFFDNSYNKLTNTWNNYNQSVVQKYDPIKKLDLNLYNFGSNDLKFDYSILTKIFKC